LERLSEILDAAVDPATRDFNCDILFSDELKRSSDVGRLSDLIMTFPMMAERRVVVIRFFDDIHPEIRKKIAAEIAKTPDTTLMIVEGEKVALSPKPLSRHLREETFKRIYEDKLPSWIRKRFAKRGKRVTEGGIALMINNVGDVLGELDGEIEKVVIAIDPEDTATERDVERIVGMFRRHTVYALNNAVGTGDFAEAVRILRSLMESEKGKETYYTMSLASHIMKIAGYHALVNSGAPPQEARKTINEKPYFWKLNRMDEQVRMFGEAEVRRAITVLADTDSDLKRSSIDNTLIMELMLPRIMP
jgi:DNA polymerase-3 subunit delta